MQLHRRQSGADQLRNPYREGRQKERFRHPKAHRSSVWMVSTRNGLQRPIDSTDPAGDRPPGFSRASPDNVAAWLLPPRSYRD